MGRRNHRHGPQPGAAVSRQGRRREREEARGLGVGPAGPGRGRWLGEAEKRLPGFRPGGWEYGGSLTETRREGESDWGEDHICLCLITFRRTWAAGFHWQTSTWPWKSVASLRACKPRDTDEAQARVRSSGGLGAFSARGHRPHPPPSCHPQVLAVSVPRWGDLGSGRGQVDHCRSGLTT